VIHRTFRSLDQAPKLVGFTVKQWAALIAGALSVLGLIHLTHLPTKPAITLCVFVIGLPAALTYVSESGGLQIGVLLREMWRWRWSAHALPAASAERANARGLLVLERTDEPAGGAREQGYDASLEDLLSEERWG
jgi:hypothetical protein